MQLATVTGLANSLTALIASGMNETHTCSHPAARTVRSVLQVKISSAMAPALQHGRNALARESPRGQLDPAASRKTSALRRHRNTDSVGPSLVVPHLHGPVARFSLATVRPELAGKAWYNQSAEPHGSTLLGNAQFNLVQFSVVPAAPVPGVH